MVEQVALSRFLALISTKVGAAAFLFDLFKPTF